MLEGLKGKLETWERPGIELDSQSPEKLKRLCYLADTIGGNGIAVDSVFARIRNG